MSTADAVVIFFLVTVIGSLLAMQNGGDSRTLTVRP